MSLLFTICQFRYSHSAEPLSRLVKNINEEMKVIRFQKKQENIR